jgi:ketosteroid isomerase-like protein
MISTGNDSSASDATLAVVHRFNAAFVRRDVDAIMALMTDDCVFENTYPPPDGARIVGAAAVRAVWEQLFAAPEAAFAWEEVFACGARAVVRWRYTWASTAGDRGYVRGVDILRVEGDRIAEKLSYVKG